MLHKNRYDTRRVILKDVKSKTVEKKGVLLVKGISYAEQSNTGITSCG